MRRFNAWSNEISPLEVNESKTDYVKHVFVVFIRLTGMAWPVNGETESVQGIWRMFLLIQE